MKKREKNKNLKHEKKLIEVLEKHQDKNAIVETENRKKLISLLICILMLLIVCGVFFVSKKANTIIGDMTKEIMRATTYAGDGTDNEIIINKVDSKTKQPITEATFELDQIEERTEPENVIGALTDNSNTYYEVDKNDEITDVLGELTDNGTYYFIKNEDGTLTPTNSKTYQVANGGTSGIQNTTANSYIPIDLTGKVGKYAVVVNANASSQSTDYGYAIINQSTSVPTYSTLGGFMYISGSYTAKDYTSMMLEGGKTYYLHLGYKKDSSVDTGNDQIVINSVKVYGTLSYKYNFVEENGVYKSTNQGKPYTTSNSYIPIDLTNCQGKYNLVVNASVSSDRGDYGYATITTTTTAPMYSSSTGRFIYISGTSVTSADYTTVLQGGQMYYLHLGYYKNAMINAGNDVFTVNSIKVELNDTELYHGQVSTNEQGKCITQIPFGKYTLTEISVQEEYELLERPIVIEFKVDGNNVLENLNAANATVNVDGEFVVENIAKPKVIVHHYINKTTEKVPSKTGDIVEDEVKIGTIGETFETQPSSEVSEYYECVGSSANTSGIYTEETQEVTYFYELKKFDYTVEYYYDGVIDGSKTETLKAPYQDVISTYTDKVITGYKLDRTENLPLTVSEVSGNNVIRVYYVKDQFDYTVEYYYDDVIDDTKTETITATYQDVINMYTDKVITGYKIDRTENLPLTISEISGNNVIRVYYVKDQFNYTVEYYYDGVIDDTKTETITATYQDMISTYTDKVITGYKFDRTENLPLTVSEVVGNNVIKVYYVKDQFNYTVEYYYDGVIDDTKTESITATYQDVINMYTDKVIIGYKFDRTENLPLTVSEVSGNNVIKVYYVLDGAQTKDLSYTVEYYKDNVKVDLDTQTVSKTVQVLQPDTLTVDKAQINTTDKYIGYKLDTENTTIPDVVNNGDVIRVYYVKDEFDYTVEYYYDGLIDGSKTETITATYQDVISTYTDKVITGYKLDRTENLPLTVSEVSGNNVIRVYYILDGAQTKDLSYTVEYYKENVKVDLDTQIVSKTVQVLQPDTLTVDKTQINTTDKYIGYKLDAENTTIPDVVNNGDIIKVYYVKDEFDYTVEYYYDGLIDGSKTETITATYQDVISTYTDKVITGYKLDRTENLPLTVSEVSGNNVIKVYYVKDQFNYTVEYYYDGVIDDTKTETITATYQDMISTYTDKVITGYKLDRTENLPLTVSEDSGNNVIRVYYVKDQFDYTVEYYYDDIIDDTKTETITATYQDVINMYTDKVITGYKFDRTENLPLTVSEVSGNNVIRVYYVLDGAQTKDLSYTVEYYKDNVKVDLDTQIVTKTVQVLQPDTLTVDKAQINTTDKYIGYKLDTENTTIPDVVNNGDIIKVYYVLDEAQTKDLSYTVEYYKNNVKVNLDTQTVTKTVQVLQPDTLTVDKTQINTTNKYIGYKLDADNTIVPDVVNSGDVIRVYYIKDQFNYTVEYYYDGLIDGSKTETITATYQDVISAYTDKVITGYKLDRTENLPLTVSEVAENNIIRVYYIIDDENTKTLSYTVEYYKDNVKVDLDTQIVNKIVQILQPDTLTVDKTQINTTDKYIGYKLDTENTTIPDVVNNGDVIRVYYVKDQFDYTVEYYYDGLIDGSKTETITATYQDVISTYTDKIITGYRLDRTENLPLTISEDESTNVIKVYYIKDQFDYTVEYYYDDVIDDTKTETITATYQDMISTYTDKIITGYKLDRIENLPLTVSEISGNNVIKVYYVKDQFDYTVEYYYDGVIDDTKTETITATYQDVISTYTDKVITGYKLDRTENLPLTVSEVAENNIIRVYYIIDDENTKTLSYTVEYYKDNVKVDLDTQTVSKTVQVLQPDTLTVDKTQINTTDKYIGYKLDTENTTIPDVVNNGDIIKVYYVLDGAQTKDLSYTVEYYKDNVKVDLDTQTVTKNVQVLQPDTLTVDKTQINTTDKYIGYKLDTENTAIPDVVNNGDIIKVYYVLDGAQTKDLSYTVEYYKDNVKVDLDTQTVTKNVQVLQPDTLTVDKTQINTTDKYIGYKLDTENTTIPDVVNNGDIIRVYYVKDQFNYTVEYYYDDVIDDTKTETITATYQDVISTYTDKVITGYKLDRIENLPLTVSEVVGNNVIKVYYVKDQFDYTVEYYYDDVIDDTKTETITATYQDVINMYTDKVITGYKLDRTENLPLTVSEVSGNNVIRVYYVKDQFDYTVEYYYDGVIDDTKTETITATYQDVISTYTDKVITGYKLDRTENLPLTVSEVVENNIIRVYYVIDDGNTKTLSYTVEYYKDNVKVDLDTQTVSKTVQVLQPDTLTVDKTQINTTDKYIGYKLDTENTTIPDVVNNGDVIRVYYVKDQFDYTVEYYYDGLIDGSKTETITATYQDVISTYTDKIITGYRLDRTENLPLTISEDESTNVIKVYYIKDQFDYTVEYYYDGLIDGSKTETITATYQDMILTYTDKIITGYRLDRTENLPLTISEDESTNVIKVYYIKDQFDYTVEYYYDDVIDDTKTETITATYQDVISTYTDKVITGYKLDRTENLPLTVSEDSGNNVIRVYYVKDQFDYTVEYYYDDVIDDTKTETITATYQDMILTYTDKNITGYKLDRTENLPLTVSEVSGNNVIRVYYVLDGAQTKDLSYTVEYYKDNVKVDLDTQTVTKNVQVLQPDTLTVDKTQINTTDKYIGYKLDTENTAIPDVVNNGDIIKVYYVLDGAQTKDLSYTVEYYKDNVKVDLDTQTVTKNVQVLQPDTLTVDKTQINTTNKYIGYKLDADNTIVPDVVNNGDVIRVYYVKDQFNYTVEYYYDGVIDDTKTETITATYQDVISTYTDKIITGYRLDRIENLPLTVSEVPGNNIIKVYYIINDGNTKTLSYTVEYYKDNVKVDLDTQIVSKTVQVLQPDTLTVDKTQINTTNKYIGYKLDAENTVIPDVVNNGDIIKVYYVLDGAQTKDLSYTVEYYKENVKVDLDTQTVSKTVQVLQPDTLTVDKTQINTTNKYIGYKLDADNTIVPDVVNSGDVIKVYYIKDQFNYTVEYYYDDVIDDTKTETITATYQDMISTYTDKVITGYKLDRTENLPLTISENETTNIIKVYYVLDESQTKEVSYEIHYYIDGELVDTTIDTRRIQILLPNQVTINKALIKLDRYLEECDFIGTDPEEIPERMESGSIINVYYERKDAQVIVKYVDKVTGEEIFEQVIKGGKVNEEYNIAEDQREIEGYTLVEKSEILEGKYTEEIQEYTYYYAKNAEVIVRYLENDETEDNSDNTILSDETIIAGYEGKEYNTTEKDIANYELLCVLGNTTGTMDAGSQEIIYYYAPKAKVTINHVDIISGEIIETEIVDGKVGDEYTSNAKDFEGYVLETIDENGDSVLPENASGIMTKEGIVVNYYYKHISAGVIEKHIDKISGKILENIVHEGNEGDEYITSMKEIEGYDYAEKDEEGNDILPENAEGRMTVELIEVKYYYVRKASVKVEYLDRNTLEKIAETEIIEGHEGDTYSTEVKEIEEYYIVKNMLPENGQGIMTVSVNEDGTINPEMVVTYYYAKKSAGVIETHINEKTDEVLEERIYEGFEGDEYTTSSKEIEGYDLDESKLPENAEGKMTIEPIEVKYYYIRKNQVKVEYIDEANEEKISEDTIIEGHEGDEYTTTPKEIEDYRLDKERVPENKDGIMTTIVNEDGTINSVIVVKYYYKKVSAGVVEKHIDIKTNDLLEEKIYSGYEGDPYKTTSKEYEEFDLVEIDEEGNSKLPENSKGTMTVNPIEVEYYYIRKTKVRVEYLDNETREKISEDTIIEGHEDDEYETKAKEIKDYELNKEKLPKNSKGTMIVERKEDKVITEVVVRYYYDKEKKTEGNNNSSNNPSNGTQNNNNTNTNNPISNNSQTIIKIYPDNSNTSNSSTKNNSISNSNDTQTNKTMLSTGDIVPVIAVEVIVLVILSNILQIIICKRKNKK